MPSPTPNEHTAAYHVLIKCLRAYLTNQATSLAARDVPIQLTDKGWEALLKLCDEHAVLPLVYQVLQSQVEQVPPAILRRMHAAAQISLQHSLYLTGEQHHLQSVLENARIPMLAYKGPALAIMAYGSLGARQFADLDLIVSGESAWQAASLLTDLGYQQSWPAAALTPAQQKDHLRTKYNITLTRPRDRSVVELHWTLSPRYLGFPPDREWLWQHTCELVIGNHHVQTLKPEVLFLSLCAHGMNHGWIRLNWIMDCAALIQRHPELDWDFIDQEAHRLGFRRTYHTALLLIELLFERSMPAAALENLPPDRAAHQLAKEAASQFPSRSLGARWPLHVPWFHLRSMDRWSQRFRYAWEITAPSNRDWEFVQLPASLQAGYYLLRPFRLLYEHMLRPVCRQCLRR